MFDNIPQEMRVYRQWICWKYVVKDSSPKPTKIPINPATGKAASVTDPSTWVGFAEACFASKNFDGIGFVLTPNDPFGFIDLDDTHGDAVSYQRQVKVFREFDSYSEVSPSGNGLHIIIKGSVPHGRKRSEIELYSSERYMTMTGNVYWHKPIEDRQELLATLWEQMGGPPITYDYGEDQVEREPDDDIIQRAATAANGDKFSTLFNGEWSSLYPSQSEADFALIDIIAFYTQSRQQIIRIFHRSNLGQRSKAQRAGYLGYMIAKSFDRQLPLLDIDGLRIKGESFKAILQDEGTGDAAPGGTTSPDAFSNAAPMPSSARDIPGHKAIFPPGLVGEIAAYLLEAAPKPIETIALAGAIGLVAGIAGRAYNVGGTGLNQYILVVANTGSGKDAISSGLSKLMQMVKPSVPASMEFQGPGEMVSSAGLIKWMAKYPTVYSIIGEFGLKLSEMSNARSSPNLQGLKRLLLQIYSKSGKGNVLDPMAYSDAQRNTIAIASPSLTMIGETTPETFYGKLDEQMIADGLLPRFMVLEYKGKVPYLSKTYMEARPSFYLVETLAALSATCLSRQAQNQVQDVRLDDEASAMFREFGDFATDKVNETKLEVTRQLWNRAHLKAIKLAAAIAVGINYVDPVITINEARYSINLINDEVLNLIDKFANGDVGLMTEYNIDEYKQIKALGNVIGEWLMPGSQYAKYKMTDKMHEDNVILLNALQMRLYTNPMFKKDRQGPGAAIKRCMQHFLDSGDIEEVARTQMQFRYGSTAKAYCVKNVRGLQNYFKEVQDA